MNLSSRVDDHFSKIELANSMFPPGSTDTFSLVYFWTEETESIKKLRSPLNNLYHMDGKFLFPFYQ